MIEFSYPYLFLLLPLPLLLRRLLPKYRESAPAVRAPFFDDLAGLVEAGKYRLITANPRLQVILFILSWLLLLCALARPQYIEEPLVKTVPTRDLLLAVDLSGSMDTEDFKNDEGRIVSRLEAVKEVLREFLLRREGDRVGLIFFGNAPFVQVPFTEDLEVCTTLLDEAQVGMAGPQTMLGDAIGLAITVFEKSEVSERVLLLLTDGNDTGSSIPPEDAARIAADKDITIYTIAVGDPEAAGEAEFDEEALKAIAAKSGGSYFYAGNREQLEEVYTRLDELSTREAETISFRPKRDIFYWPLALLLLLSFSYHAVLAIRAEKVTGKGGEP